MLEELSRQGSISNLNEEIVQLEGGAGGEGGAATAAGRKDSQNSALQFVKAAIDQRNAKTCRPRFFVRPKPKKQIDEGKNLRLKIAVSANPPAEVHWEKNGVILETGNKYNLFREADFFYLEVHSLSPQDSGMYNCTAKNAEGIAICTANVEVLEAKGAGEDGTATPSRRRQSKKDLLLTMAPRMRKELPKKSKSTIGVPLTVACTLEGSPMPSISWFHNGSPLTSHPERYALYFDGETAKLSLLKTSSMDAGKYTCIAENSAGTLKTEMELELEKPPIREGPELGPKFLEPKKRIRHEIDASKNESKETVLIAELIEGTEPIEVKWISPSRIEMATDSTAYRIDRVGKDSRLTIFDAFPTDSGDYKCVAENKFGNAKCTVDLKISEKRKANREDAKEPAVSAKKSQISTKKGQKFVDLAFAVEGDEPVLCWYRLSEGGQEKHIIPNSKKYETSSKGNGQNVALRIYDVQPADSGNYKIVAINSCGEASGIVELKVTQ